MFHQRSPRLPIEIAMALTLKVSRRCAGGVQAGHPAGSKAVSAGDGDAFTTAGAPAGASADAPTDAAAAAATAASCSRAVRTSRAAPAGACGKSLGCTLGQVGPKAGEDGQTGCCKYNATPVIITTHDRRNHRPRQPLTTTTPDHAPPSATATPPAATCDPHRLPPPLLTVVLRICQLCVFIIVTSVTVLVLAVRLVPQPKPVQRCSRALTTSRCGCTASGSSRHSG